MRIFLIGLPLAALCLTGFTTACSSTQPVLSGVLPAQGMLTGHLYAVGGPAPGTRRPWPGTVTLTGSGMHRDIKVGAVGGYSAWVPPGTYTVAGRSPLYQDGTGACRATGPVTVASGHRTEADVLCQLR
ncbi:MAG TPA: hypothetical protein VFQ68_39525 [Streptosporangiaceae bacterium]|nr:hypothetical protein [Streptosporangiaceae bacterium]